MSGKLIHAPAAGAVTASMPSWRRIVGTWLIIGVVAAVQTWLGLSIGRARVPTTADDWILSAIEVLHWSVWIPITPLAFMLVRRVPVPSDHPVKPLLVHAVAALATSALVESVWYYLTMSLYAHAAPKAFTGFVVVRLYPPIVLGRIVAGACVYGAIASIAAALEYQRRLRAREVAEAEIASALVDAQNQALKMQLHPHFLFNALHAVTVLIRENPSQAIRTVAQLGDLLRLTLARAETSESRLADELELLRLYFAIEQTRFSDRLRVTFAVDDRCLDALLPDLSLQPLAENAIRHGVATTVGPAAIVVSARCERESLVVEITDDGEGQQGPQREGVGLRSVRRRLQLLYPDAHELRLAPASTGVRPGCIATLRVPFHVPARTGLEPQLAGVSG